MKRVLKFFKNLHQDEQGAEGIEKILILAAVALPLLGLLIYFRDVLFGWLDTKANTVIGDAQDEQDPSFGN